MSHVRRIDPEKEPIHPGTAWLETGLAEHRAAEEEKRNRRRGGRNRKPAIKTQSPSKPSAAAPEEAEAAPKKTSLYQPVAQLMVPITADGDSSAPTPAGSSPEQEPSTPDTDVESGAEAHPTDKYGVHLPKKPAPRNGEAPQNRFAQQPHFTFDQDEIGVRIHHSKATNRNEIIYQGMDAKSQPKKFHFDQIARGYNSSKHRPEDLDQEKVQTYGMHPVYGTPIKGARNPSPKRARDWSKPLSETKPIEFLVKTSDPDHLKPRIHTSRSTWIIQAEEAWTELGAQLKMASSLDAIGAREEMPPPPKISPFLLKAANTAQAEDNLKASTQPAPTTPQRSHGYDPVRDIGYTTYPRQLQREPPGNLGILADAAELRGSNIPQFSIPREPITNSRLQQLQFAHSQPDFQPLLAPLPAPLPAPMTAQMPPPPPPPQHAHQFLHYNAPPQPGSSAGRYKDILPAPPPQNRRAAPPARGWFNTHPFSNGQGFGSGSGSGSGSGGGRT